MDHIKRAARTFAALTLVAMSSAPAFAQSVLPGSYSSWTDAQKTQAAQLLKQGSEAACASYIDAAKDPQDGGGQRAAYEAAACIGAYYVNHLPSDYPGTDQIKAGVMQNYNNAKALGSNIPVPAFKS
jgi:hypothetical protein